MRRKFKSRKRKKFKKIFYIILIFFIIILINFYINKINFINSKSKFIKNLLSNSNTYSTEFKNGDNFIDNIYNYINKNIFNNPVNLLKSELNYENNNENNIKNNILEFSYVENTLPKVFIYNSHQSETYSYKYLEEYNIVPDVLMASKMLKEKLEAININTLVLDVDLEEYKKENNLNHGESYIASRHFLESFVNKYNSIDLFIDLHRDAIKHDSTYTNIDGKDCAKILFVIGLEYSTYNENLDVVNKLNNIILNKYPTLTRGIMKKEGYGVNGVYNQDLSNNVILIEVGGNENNIDEINNTLDILAKVIGEYINEKEKE